MHWSRWRFGRALISSEGVKKKYHTDQDQNAGPPIASAAEHHESNQQHPDPAAKRSGEEGRSVTVMFMSVHEISFGYAYYTCPSP